MSITLADTKCYRELIRMLLISNYRLSCKFLVGSNFQEKIELTKTKSTQLPCPLLSEYHPTTEDIFAAKLQIYSVAVGMFKDLVDWLLNLEAKSVPYIER